MRGQRHAPAAPYPRERPGTHCTGGWVGLRAGLDRCGKSRPHRDSIPGPSSLYEVAIPTMLPGPDFRLLFYKYSEHTHKSLRNACRQVFKKMWLRGSVFPRYDATLLGNSFPTFRKNIGILRSFFVLIR